MASLVTRGRKWYVKYYDAHGRQAWAKGFTDKAETQKLANRIEDQKTRIQRGEVDPQAEVRRVERARPVAEHIAAYRDALKARGSSDNHIAYTIADIEKCFARTRASRTLRRCARGTAAGRALFDSILFGSVSAHS